MKKHIIYLLIVFQGIIYTGKISAQTKVIHNLTLGTVKNDTYCKKKIQILDDKPTTINLDYIFNPNIVGGQYFEVIMDFTEAGEGYNLQNFRNLNLNNSGYIYPVSSNIWIGNETNIKLVTLRYYIPSTGNYRFSLNSHSFPKTESGVSVYKPIYITYSTVNLGQDPRRYNISFDEEIFTSFISMGENLTNPIDIGIIADDFSRSLSYDLSKYSKAYSSLKGKETYYKFDLKTKMSLIFKVALFDKENNPVLNESSVTLLNASNLKIDEFHFNNSNQYINNELDAGTYYLVMDQGSFIGRADVKFIFNKTSLGQNIGNTISKEISYKYNIRSWLENIQNEGFSEDLKFTYNGNVKDIEWITGIQRHKRKYTLTYDNLSRLSNAFYNGIGSEKYDTHYTYDKMGNIRTLVRYGKINKGNSSISYGKVDDLVMSYNGNQITKIIDNGINTSISESEDFKDYTNNNGQYTYNQNGALKSDTHKGISNIEYNFLNLPQAIEIANPHAKGRIKYLYSAVGKKLQVIHETDPVTQSTPVAAATDYITGNTGNKTTDYIGNMIYENGALKRILIDGGYYDMEDGKYYFYVNDHLGNNRLVVDQDGKIIQANHYYPFGKSFADSEGQDKQPYKYGNKELDRMHGLELYDFSARYMDGMRFTSIDPLSEKKPWLTPYHFCSNNPFSRIDPNGMFDISKLNGKSHYGVVSVFPQIRDRKLQKDYEIANNAGVATILVESIEDFADGMAQMAKDGITVDNYVLNSHGSEGFFYIGNQYEGNKVTSQTNPFVIAPDLTCLKDGLSGKKVFISACNVTKYGNSDGLKAIQNLSNTTNSTIISSDHLIGTGFKYDGSDYLSKPWSSEQLELMPSLKSSITNTYHLATPGEKDPIKIFNFTIDLNLDEKFKWDKNE